MIHNRETIGPVTLFNAQAATGTSTGLDIRNFRHVLLATSCASGTAATLKIKGSIIGDAPDFAAAQSGSAVWDYVAVYDLQDDVLIAGDTGIVFASGAPATYVRNFVINSDHFNHIAVEVSAFTSGTVTAVVIGARD